MNGEVGVSHILRNDAPVVAIVGNRVYLDEPPQTKALPFIIVEVRNVEPIISKSGEAEKDIDTIGVVAFADDRRQLKTLVEAMRTALDHKEEGTYNSVTIEELILKNISFSHEEETNRKIYTADNEYELRVIL